MTIRKDDLEEARLLGGDIVLRWKCPRELTVTLMSAQDYHQMLRDFDSAISIVEQEYPPEDDSHKFATALRKRWFP